MVYEKFILLTLQELLPFEVCTKVRELPRLLADYLLETRLRVKKSRQHSLVLFGHNLLKVFGRVTRDLSFHLYILFQQ